MFVSNKPYTFPITIILDGTEAIYILYRKFVW